MSFYRVLQSGHLAAPARHEGAQQTGKRTVGHPSMLGISTDGVQAFGSLSRLQRPRRVRQERWWGPLCGAGPTGLRSANTAWRYTGTY